MRNDHLERPDGVVEIYCTSRKGSTATALVHQSSMEKLRKLDVTWFVTDKGYVASNLYIEERRRQLLLHRVVADAPDGLPVDHLNHDTLDNRGDNLRVVVKNFNALNRAEAAGETLTGIRGVTMTPDRKKYQAQVLWQGARRHLGYFYTVETAASAVLGALRVLDPVSANIYRKHLVQKGLIPFRDKEAINEPS